MGLTFGCMAGFFAEIGWTGFAFPAMRLRRNPFGAAVSLGLLWAAWHITVIDYLGTATPHGKFWLPFFLAFTRTRVVALRPPKIPSLALNRILAESPSRHILPES
jgi:membrane protease YdiL (CAAX protease family)